MNMLLNYVSIVSKQPSHLVAGQLFALTVDALNGAPTNMEWVSILFEADVKPLGAWKLYTSGFDKANELQDYLGGLARKYTEFRFRLERYDLSHQDGSNDLKPDFIWES